MPTKTAVRNFCKAARKADLAYVKDALAADPTLLDAPVSAPPKKDDGQTALQVAFKCGSFEVAEFLIEIGANVNYMESESVNEWRLPVLHNAIRACVFSSELRRGRAVLATMLDQGADPNRRDSYGNSPLDRAMLDVTQYLHLKTKWDEFPPLFRVLLAAGADLHAACETRESVDADERGHEAYRFLVQGMGAEHAWQPAVWRDDPTGLTGAEACDNAGRTPLMTAIIFGAEQTMSHLLMAGADVLATDTAGWSALGYAWWSPRLSERLLQAGADPNQAIGDTGLTPFANTFYKRDLAELMLEHGADPTTRNSAGKTYAEAQG